MCVVIGQTRSIRIFKYFTIDRSFEVRLYDLVVLANWQILLWDLPIISSTKVTLKHERYVLKALTPKYSICSCYNMSLSWAFVATKACISCILFIGH